MPHLTPTEIIRLVSGELPPPDAAALETHAAGCPECAARLRSQRALWSVLAADRDQPSTVDLAAAVARRLTEHPSRTWQVLSRTPVRIAAAMLIGIGAGYGAAQWTLRGGGPGPASAGPDLAAAVPDVELLTGVSPAGLYAALVELDEDHGGTEDAS
mgnify:CR=1 FL=1